jgi:hypothetical protein
MDWFKIYGHVAHQLHCSCARHIVVALLHCNRVCQAYHCSALIRLQRGCLRISRTPATATAQPPASHSGEAPEWLTERAGQPETCGSDPRAHIAPGKRTHHRLMIPLSRAANRSAAEAPSTRMNPYPDWEALRRLREQPAHKPRAYRGLARPHQHSNPLGRIQRARTANPA